MINELHQKTNDLGEGYKKNDLGELKFNIGTIS
jgi:hypothetical protein